MFTGIRTLFARVTRGYGDHSPLTRPKEEVTHGGRGRCRWLGVTVVCGYGAPCSWVGGDVEVGATRPGLGPGTQYAANSLAPLRMSLRGGLRAEVFLPDLWENSALTFRGVCATTVASLELSSATGSAPGCRTRSRAQRRQAVGAACGWELRLHELPTSGRRLPCIPGL